MIVDLDNGYWIDDGSEPKETDDMITSFMLGFSPVIEIMRTDYVKRVKLCNESESLKDNLKYVSIFNSYGNTFDEMELTFESDFTEFPLPQLFPVIAQSNDLQQLKLTSIKYLEMQWGASKLSKSDLRAKMEAEDKTLMKLLERYMNMFTYKNELN